MPRQGVKAAQPNSQKKTQGGCQIEETKKYGPNKRPEQNPRKRTNKQNGESPPMSRAHKTGDQDAQRTH